MVLPSRRLSLSGPVDDEDGVAGADIMISAALRFRRLDVDGVLLIIFSAVLRGLLTCTNIAISIVVA